MLIAHVVPTPFGAAGIYGGGERYPLELCRALSRHVRCRLITFGRETRRETEGDLEIVVLKTLVRWRGHPVHALGLGLARELSPVDLVHTHQTRSAPSAAAGLMGRIMNKPVVTTDHGLGRGRWGVSLPIFERFLVVSLSSAASLRSPPERTAVVMGGVDPDRFHPDGGPRAGVLYVGRITPHKGLDRLIRALPSGVPLRIVGSPGHDPREPERAYPQLLHSLAQGKDVTFSGPVGEDSLPGLHRSASVFALPSVSHTVYGKDIAISELLGLSLLEAMASGTPVVASRLGGVPEIVRHGVTGYLVNPGSVGELRERIDELVNDGAVARRMGEAGRRLVVDALTWEHCAQRCLSAYDEVLSSRPE